MLSILVPICGKTRFDNEAFGYPKPLIEIRGRPMIHYVIECLGRIRAPKRFIFPVMEEDCLQYHLDDVLRLLMGESGAVIRLAKRTAGAACTALLAIEHIDNADSLLISNSDHVILDDLNRIHEEFARRDVDGGVVCFDSVHPQWSFVRIDEGGGIVEAAEKRPISRNAVAGLYYFKRGADFVRCAMASIRKDARVNGHFYVSSALNEMVLEGRRLEAVRIDNANYHNFYESGKIKEFERAPQGAADRPKAAAGVAA
ncbi:MAG: glycosyltransferase family 2 protein [Verrucomicrobiota bacterium]|nr:glycosyltransferase family 2 protein [Verrucomicrobiota bacterium]